MTDVAASFFALLYFLLIPLSMVAPFLLVYCVWRFLRDLRRIAKALESVERDDGMPWQLRDTELAKAVEARRSSIVPSAFGRH